MIPPSGYIIRHHRDGEFGPWQTRNGIAFRDNFTVQKIDEPNSYVFKIFLRVKPEGVWVEQEIGRRSKSANFQESFLAWVVERIVRALRDDEFNDVQNTLDVGEDEIHLMDRLAAEKHCDYQVNEGRDLYCTADTTHDALLGPTRVVGLKNYAPHRPTNACFARCPTDAFFALNSVIQV
jgi:hypothetical protein